MIDEILLFLAKKVGHAGGGEHIYIYIYIYRYAKKSNRRARKAPTREHLI